MSQQQSRNQFFAGLTKYGGLSTFGQLSLGTQKAFRTHYSICHCSRLLQLEEEEAVEKCAVIYEPLLPRWLKDIEIISRFALLALLTLLVLDQTSLSGNVRCFAHKRTS